MRIILFLTVFLFLPSAFILAQTPEMPRSRRDTTQDSAREQQRQQTEINNKLREYGRGSGSSGLNNERSPTGAFIRRTSAPLKSPINKEQRRRLAPDDQLLSKYSEFLKQPRAGLVKIFSDTGCEANANVIRVDGNCLEWIPNSAFYSFRKKEHTVDYLSDITYKNGFLVADGILTQGILTALGDVPLEGVSLSTAGMKFLNDYVPAVHAREALNQLIRIRNGVKDEGYEYRKAIRAAENMTYALRVVAYRGKFYSTYQGRRFDVLFGDERKDLILAFRVLKNNADGSITLLWKELSRQKSPKVIFPKKGKTFDSGKVGANE